MRDGWEVGVGSGSEEVGEVGGKGWEREVEVWVDV